MTTTKKTKRKPRRHIAVQAWRVIGLRRIYFRSKMEANYARFLEWQVEHGHLQKWEHEPETFWFHGIKRGVVSYLPDFRVTLNDGSIEYHEVKGYMDAKSKTKLKRMDKYHPRVKVVLIDKKRYAPIAKAMAPMLAGWE